MLYNLKLITLPVIYFCIFKKQIQILNLFILKVFIVNQIDILGYLTNYFKSVLLYL
jgi:hypothetical protein